MVELFPVISVKGLLMVTDTESHCTAVTGAPRQRQKHTGQARMSFKGQLCPQAPESPQSCG